MKTFPLASTLERLLRNELGGVEPGISIFAFGSILTAGAPRDVDVLVIFDSREIAVDDAIKLRKRIRDAIQTIINLPVDIILLSISEADQIQFLQKVDAVRIF